MILGEMQLIVIGGWHCLVGGGVFFGLLGFFMLVYLHNLKLQFLKN